MYFPPFLQRSLGAGATVNSIIAAMSAAKQLPITGATTLKGAFE
jgi:hypothetical protein